MNDEPRVGKNALDEKKSIMLCLLFSFVSIKVITQTQSIENIINDQTPV